MNNNFLKYLYLGMFIAFTTTGIAQVMSQKVGTNPTIITRSVALEVESTTKGFLPPRMTNEQMTAIVTPAAGLMVYCTNCIPAGLCVFDGIIWKQIPTGIIEPSVIANCSSNGFSGLINTGIPISGATFSTTITNNSLSDVGPISFSAGDLVLSGVDAGLVVGTPSPASATISPGGSQLITYPITGTPASIGTLTGTWTNGSFTCSNAKEVGIPAEITLTSVTETTNQIAMSSATITPITYTVTGTGVSNVTVTGLPAGVTYSYNSGTLTISGTPTVNGDFTYTITTVGGDPNDTATGRISVVIVNCSSNGFSGTITSGITLSGATFSMTITNNSSNAVGPISFSTNNLVLSGVSGLVVGTPSPASASISPGDSQLITYPITGTPASAGTLTGTWTNGLLSCSNTKEVGTPAVITLTSATDTNNQTAIPDVAITPITYSVAGTGVSNVTVTGLPAGVTHSYSSGTLTISGSSTEGGEYSYIITTLGGDPNATATGTIIILIQDRMYGVADNSGDSNSHKFLYKPITAADGRTWLNNNLGAHYANVNHASFNPVQQATSEQDYLAYGSFFQWGRKPDGHELITYTSSTSRSYTSPITTTLSNSPTDNQFIASSSISQKYDWRTSQSSSLWSTEASENNPCPVGYRVPTSTEFSNLVATSGITNIANASSSILKFTAAGSRSTNGSSFSSQTTGGYYTSSVNGISALTMRFSSTSASISTITQRATGQFVRCIKD